MLFDPQRQLVPFDCIMVLRKITQTLELKPTGTDPAFLFAFITHVLLLNHLSVQDRARRLEPITKGLKKSLMAFIPPVLLTAETVIAASNTTIDVDLRVFISLIRFFAENTGLTLQQAIGSDIAMVMETEFQTFIVPVADFAQFSPQFRPRSTPSPPTHDLRLLPFSNPVFDKELAPLYGVVTEAVEAENNDNPRKTNLPKHLGGKTLASLTEWQRKKKLRSDQRFMKSLHDQAATLTGTLGAALQQIKIPPVGSTLPPSLKVFLFQIYTVMFLTWCTAEAGPSAHPAQRKWL